MCAKPNPLNSSSSSTSALAPASMPAASVPSMIQYPTFSGYAMAPSMSMGPMTFNYMMPGAAMSSISGAFLHPSLPATGRPHALTKSEHDEEYTSLTHHHAKSQKVASLSSSASPPAPLPPPPAAMPQAPTPYYMPMHFNPAGYALPIDPSTGMMPFPAFFPYPPAHTSGAAAGYGYHPPHPPPPPPSAAAAHPYMSFSPFAPWGPTPLDPSRSPVSPLPLPSSSVVGASSISPATGSQWADGKPGGAISQSRSSAFARKITTVVKQSPRSPPTPPPIPPPHPPPFVSSSPLPRVSGTNAANTDSSSSSSSSSSSANIHGSNSIIKSDIHGNGRVRGAGASADDDVMSSAHGHLSSGVAVPQPTKNNHAAAGSPPRTAQSPMAETSAARALAAVAQGDSSFHSGVLSARTNGGGAVTNNHRRSGGAETATAVAATAASAVKEEDDDDDDDGREEEEEEEEEAEAAGVEDDQLDPRDEDDEEEPREEDEEEDAEPDDKDYDDNDDDEDYGKRFSSSGKKLSSTSKPACYACPKCSATFNTRFSLKRHGKKHTGERPHSCSYPGCGKTFAERSTMRRHMRTHTGEKPYTCSVGNCGKKFADRINLKRHEMAHNGVFPHKCKVPRCGRGFLRLQSLYDHMANEHGEPLLVVDEGQ